MWHLWAVGILGYFGSIAWLDNTSGTIALFFVLFAIYMTILGKVFSK